MISNRIHQLDNILANQIAAGEVVERPASVVKELMENSIDAGADRIDVEIEKGGAALIRVKDNGNGIHPDDLTLALSRHATSKIKKTEDLGAIESLGFRGEALASISSVSRLTLTSKWLRAEQALEAEAHGRDMEVTISPAGLNQGTLVEVRELFFNTPARRRFMRTDKTEFRQIETVINRIVLSHPKISVLLKHNGKKIRHFKSAGNRELEEQRVAQIIGKDFIANCVHFSLQHEVESGVIKFKGWLGLAEYHRSMNDGQFVFINGRAVKDAVVSHAIREAYAERIPKGRLPAYVIDIQLDANTVDVNVHPTKHEVRFQHQRMVHDLIIRAVSEVLNEAGPKVNQNPFQQEPNPNPLINYSMATAKRELPSYSKVSETTNIYNRLIESASTQQSSSGCLVAEKYLLLADDNGLLLVSLTGFMQYQWPQNWQQHYQKETVCSAPILFPVNTKVTMNDKKELQLQQVDLRKMGLEILLDSKQNQFKLLTIPLLFSGISEKTIVSVLLEALSKKTGIEFQLEFTKKIAADQNTIISFSKCNQLNNPQKAMLWFEKNKPENFQTGIDVSPNNVSSEWVKIISVSDLDKLFFSEKQ